MKNNAYFLICLICILFGSIYSCDFQDRKEGKKTVLEWHDSLKTKPKRVFISKDGNLNNGVYKLYRHDGTLLNESQLRNGKKNGVAKNYYSNGELFYVVEYKNDILDGEIKTYSKDGSLLSKGTYCNGKKCGDWYYYNKEGNIKEILSFD